MGVRSSLYKVARLMGDANAVKKGKAGKRVARRAAGKATGRSLGNLSLPRLSLYPLRFGSQCVSVGFSPLATA